MSFDYDFAKVKDDILIEPGWYPFRILEAEEGKSKNFNPMVKVVATCLDPRFRDQQIWHWVVFLPEEKKGSGMAKHFVKCLGFDVEAKSRVDPDKWVGKTFMGKVCNDEYQGKKNNRFEAISPIKDEAAVAAVDESPFND
jgi:hypothetical protein